MAFSGFSKMTMSVALGSTFFGVFYGAMRNNSVNKLETQRIANLEKIHEQRIALPLLAQLKGEKPAPAHAAHPTPAANNDDDEDF